MSNGQLLPLSIKRLLESDDVKCFAKYIDNLQKVFEQQESVMAESILVAEIIENFAYKEFNRSVKVEPDAAGNLKIGIIAEDGGKNDKEYCANFAEKLKECVRFLHCLSWLKEKVVLRFDKTLIEALRDSELPGNLPNLHLPFNHFYIAFDEAIKTSVNDKELQQYPDIIKIDYEVHGAFVNLRTFSDGSQHLALFFIGHIEVTRKINGEIKTVNIPNLDSSLIVNSNDGSLGRILTQVKEYEDRGESFRKMVLEVFSMILYLSQDPSELDMQKRGSSSKKEKIVTDKNGYPRFPTEYAIGTEIGRKLNLAYNGANASEGDGSGKKSIHVRRGHFAIRYYGSIKYGRGKGHQQERLVWLPPTLINADAMESVTDMQVVQESVKQ